MSRTKAEIQAQNVSLIAETLELQRELEESDYLSPEECTALEKYHRGEVWIWTRVAEQCAKDGNAERAQEIRDEIVTPHREHAEHYALRAAKRAVEWDDETKKENSQ